MLGDYILREKQRVGSTLVSLSGRGINTGSDCEDPGFLHGAYFEGLEIAKLIAGCVKGGSCVDMEHFLQITNARPYEN